MRQVPCVPGPQRSWESCWVLFRPEVAVGGWSAEAVSDPAPWGRGGASLSKGRTGDAAWSAVRGGRGWGREVLREKQEGVPCVCLRASRAPPRPSRSHSLVARPGFKSSSVQFSHSVMSNSSRPRESQHARPLHPSSTPIINPCPSSR